MVLKLNRRGLLVAAGVGVTATVFSKRPALLLAQQATGGTQRVRPDLANVKACVFDVFGTVVDWRSSVIAEANNWGEAKGLHIDWAEFTDRWRLGYRPTLDKVRNGEIP